MSPCTCITPSIGAIGCKSIATMRGRSPSLVAEHIRNKESKKASDTHNQITHKQRVAHILTWNQGTVLLVHTGSGSKPTSGNGKSSNQTNNFGTDGLLGTAQGRIPGSSFQEQHTDQPHVSLLIISPKGKCFSSAPYCSFMVRDMATTTSTGWASKQVVQSDTLEDVELLVYLEELEGAASSPSFLLGLPVVDVLSSRRAARWEAERQSGWGGAGRRV